MSKLSNWFEEVSFWLRTGRRLEISNNGNPVDQIVIRYKDVYLSIMLDGETKEPTGDFSWARSPGMFHVPVREHYVAKRVKL